MATEAVNADLRLIHCLKNDRGGTYFVVVQCSNPGRFVRELWAAMPDNIYGCPTTDEEALLEWTNWSRSIRTSVSWEGACIRTHGMNVQNDKDELDGVVLQFLREQGLPV